MQEVIRFALLGFGVGALYALASQGLIVIYRGSGVLNLALGAIGLVGAYFEWELHNNHGWPYGIALIIGVLVSCLIGAATHYFIMRPLRHVSPLVRVIATLGVLITIQAIAVLRYQANARFVPSVLPTNVWHIHGTIVISADRIILLGIAAFSTLCLWMLYRYTKFGLGTSAVAENMRAAASLGWSPDRVATLNWVLGCGLAGLAAILIVPIVTLQPAVLTNLVLAATAAALVAAFRSFPIAFAAGLAIGIVQTEINRYVHQPGVGDSVPFVLIVVWLMVRGQALPLRDYLLQRLPTIGSGRPNWPGIAFGVVIGVVLMTTTSPIWIDSFTVTLGTAVILLSIVVLTGYAGQLSLAQYAIAGFGAYTAGRLMAVHDLPFWLGLLIGILVNIPLGVLFALPAARTRGINLAIVTLGLGTAIELILFTNSDLTGGASGTIIKSPHILGLNIDASPHPTRYGLFTLICFTIAALAVANIRRGRTGRRLIAVRTNERAAAALGISVSGVKVYAFALSSAIAGLGGILLAFRSTAISYTDFSNFTSITDVGYAMIGGIGYLVGPVIGGQLADGGLDARIFDALGSGIAKYVPLIGGVSLILLVLLNQNGIAKEAIAQIGLGALQAREAASVPCPAQAGGGEGASVRGRRARIRANARGARRHRALRRHHRGRRGLAHGHAREDRRADRPERRRQDHADRRRHRLHPHGPGHAHVRRPGDPRLVSREARPRRPRPLVPVARAVRGLDRVRQPARRQRPARPRLVRARPRLPVRAAAAGRGGQRHQGVPLRERPRPAGGGPLLRPAAPAGDRPRGGDPAERPAAGRARRRPRRPGVDRARRRSSSALPRTGAWASCWSSTT